MGGGPGTRAPRQGGGPRESGTSGRIHPGRLARLRRELREPNAALLVRHLPNIRYLTGFTGSAAALLVHGDRLLLVTDGRYQVQAAEEVPPTVEVEIADDGLREAVASEISGTGTTRVGFESDHVTVHELEELRDRCPEVRWEPVRGRVERLRSRKEEPEVEAIRAAAELAEAVLADFLDEIREGVTERELAAELEYRLRGAGSEGAPFETIVAAGERSALPHARPTDRRLREGDLLLVDFGAIQSGYCCDLTRCFVLGASRKWQRELHSAVRRAQDAALSVVSAGSAAASVDRAAREILEEAGLGEAFTHSTGHGLGLEVHEDPRLHRSSEEVLAPGQVVTVEPGAYLSGRGGVRIEDDVLVQTEDHLLLSKFSTALVEL